MADSRRHAVKDKLKYIMANLANNIEHLSVVGAMFAADHPEEYNELCILLAAHHQLRERVEAFDNKA